MRKVIRLLARTVHKQLHRKGYYGRTVVHKAFITKTAVYKTALSTTIIKVPNEGIYIFVVQWHCSLTARRSWGSQDLHDVKTLLLHILLEAINILLYTSS